MMCHCPELGSASDWSCHVGNLIQPIRNTTQICVVMRHQYGISALVSQTSFGGETSGTVVASPKCRLFWSISCRWQRIRLSDKAKNPHLGSYTFPNECHKVYLTYIVNTINCSLVIVA